MLVLAKRKETTPGEDTLAQNAEGAVFTSSSLSKILAMIAGTQVFLLFIFLFLSFDRCRFWRERAGSI